MIELEKLYNCVEKHLRVPELGWQGFADEFKSVYRADMALYRVVLGSGSPAHLGMDVIATSNVDCLREYVDRRIYELHPVAESSLAPLEPSRRTDIMADEEFSSLGELSEFLLSHGIFYMMVVPALMPDGSYVGFYVWRGRSEQDFGNLEKQRLALLMRHLLAIVGDTQLTPSHPDADMVAFGRKFGLTPTEVDVMAALINGHSLKSIAGQSGRSYGTVRWHVQNILEKCQVTTQRNLLSEFYRLVKR